MALKKVRLYRQRMLKKCRKTIGQTNNGSIDRQRNPRLVYIVRRDNVQAPLLGQAVMHLDLVMNNLGIISCVRNALDRNITV